MKKYWDGKTSTAEEALLKAACVEHADLFSSEERKYLISLQDFKKLKLDNTFSNELESKINNLEEKIEGSSLVVTKIHWRKTITSIAATLLLLISIAWGIRQWDSNSPLTEHEPETIEAFETAQEALLLISSKMNKVQVLTEALGNLVLLRIKSELII